MLREAPGTWSTHVSDQYMVGKVPSGGYVASLVLNCVVEELQHAATEPPLPRLKFAPSATHTDVFSANIHYMSSTLPGPATCHVEIIKTGKTTTSCEASMYQQNKETMRCLVTCGNLLLARTKGPNLSKLSVEDAPPALPPLDECIRVDAGDNTPASVRSRVHCFVPSQTAAQYKGSRATKEDGSFDEETLLHRKQAIQTTHGADYSGYMMYAKEEMGHPTAAPTLKDAPIFLDAGVPPILGAYVTGWVPTLNLTFQFINHPASNNHGVFRFRFKTSRVSGGFLVEDGELWDMNDDNLIAVSRQRAMVGVSQVSKGKL